MERALANAMVWSCFEGWADKYHEALNDELRGEDGSSRLLDTLAGVAGSSSDTLDAFRKLVLPIVDIYDANLLKGELAAALAEICHNPRVPLEEFAEVAFGVSNLLDEFGIPDDDMIELAYADGILADGNRSAAREHYELVFSRFMAES